MAKSHESTLYIVEKYRAGELIHTGTTLVFRTRAKARAYAAAKNTKTRKFRFKVRVAKWGPAA